MIWGRIFWLLHISNSYSQFLSRLRFYIISALWVITHYHCPYVLLHFSFKYWMCGMKENFLSKIMPRNLYWSTPGISDSSRFNVGLLCIFLSWQKCTHWVLVLEILKPFIIAHMFILLMPCCSWHSAVHIYCDAQVINKEILMNSRIQAIGDAIDFYVEEGYW